MNNNNIIKSNYATLLLIILMIFPSYVFAINSASQIDIVQENSIYNINIEIPKDIYITDETLDVSIVGDAVELESIFYQDSEVFDGKDVFFNNIKIKAVVKGEAGSSFDIVVDYQNCSKQHECTERLSFKDSFNVLKELQTKQKTQKSEDESKINEEVAEQDSIANMLKDKHLFITLLTFFGFGLLLSFTPCMLPVIPILSAIIISKQNEMSAKRGFFLSLTYVLSMSLVYAITGALAASLGSNIQAMFQEPWIIILFSAFFFVLSLAMFGTFNIEMPKKIQSIITSRSASSGRRTYLSVVFLGAISALIVGPCVAPPLAGALIYISQTGNEVIGGLSLFVMSLGMGIPLLLLGAGAGRFLPKPGQWMETIKLIFGIVMLAFSIWILSRIVDEQTTMFLWGVLVLSLAVFMDFFEEKPLTEYYLHYQIKKIFSLLCLIFGTVLILGAIGGAKNIYNPLEPYIINNKTHSSTPQGVVFETIDASEMHTSINNSSNPTLFFFTADWCDNCKELERDVFSQNDVAQMLSVFDLYAVDITKNSDEDIAMLKKYGLFGPPGIIFFDENKNEFSSHRLVGYKDKQEFIKHVEKVKNLL